MDRTIASAKANMGGLFANESVAEFLERIRPNKMHANKAMDELFSLPGMQMFAVDSIEQGNVLGDFDMKFSSENLQRNQFCPLKKFVMLYFEFCPKICDLFL